MTTTASVFPDKPQWEAALCSHQIQNISVQA